MARACKLDIIDVEGATGDYHTNLFKKGEKAVELLIKSDYDFCFLHIK
jgi:2,3-bisphosphoglycerate-independent phosphoglycerate mutase